MAKYAILSDIHANGDALKVVLEKCRELAVDRYVSLGDMSGFNPHAKFAVNWTRQQLTEEERAWLVSMPYRSTIPGTNSTVVHATLDTPENWGYIFDAHHAADNFSYQFTQICFCGHSHVPVAFVKKPITSLNERSIDDLPEWTTNADDETANVDFNCADELPVEVKVGYKYLFNVGSIGQPRNRDPRASFAVFDTDKHIITRYRLPERLALRLAAGT